MIEEIRIQGYRSLRDVTWRPGKLNVLIGPNGGGKSNLLRALRLFRTAADGTLRDEIIGQGGMGSILWNGVAKEILLSMSYSNATGLSDSPKVGNYILILERLGSSGDFVIKTERLSGEDIVYWERLADSGGPIEPTKTFLSATNRPEAPRQTAGEYFRIHDDLRVDQKAQAREPAVSRNERYLAEDGQNLVAFLSSLYQRNRDFEASIDRAMSAAFPDDYDKLLFPPESSGRIELNLRKKHIKRLDSAADLSDGTIRFLMLAAILCHPEPPNLIAIDEPELGLHPRMLSIVADLAAAASQRTQVVISTHSDRFLDAFDEQLPTTTVVHWDGKETQLRSFAPDQLKSWLKDYSLGEFSFSGEAEALA